MRLEDMSFTDYLMAECDLRERQRKERMKEAEFEKYAKENNLFVCSTNVIEQIRAEIEQTAKDYDKFDDYRRVRGLWIALDIIDKYAEQEPCDDAISRQAVLDGIEELKQSPWATDKRGNGFEYLITETLDIVADLCVKQEPSVRPQEQTGHWIEYPHNSGIVVCNQCKGIRRDCRVGYTNYCNKCGARMVEQKESEVNK